jgi:hypothetical protein
VTTTSEYLVEHAIHSGLFLSLPARASQLKCYARPEWLDGSKGVRPDSYSLDTIGEISQWVVMRNSKGRCGSRRTIIYMSTLASTLLCGDSKRGEEGGDSIHVIDDLAAHKDEFKDDLQDAECSELADLYAHRWLQLVDGLAI